MADLEYSTEQKRKDALQEYYFIEDLIDRFDQRSLMIKSWSVTLSAAILAASTVKASPLLALAASFSALIFWYVEALWKYFQEAPAERVKELEELIAHRVDEYDGPKIAKSFSEHFKRPWALQHFPSTLWYTNVLLPHVLIAAIGAGLFLYLI